MPYRRVQVGQQFTRLTVIAKDTERKHHYVCRCECGQTRSVFVGNLNNNRQRSCGCLIAERQRELHTTHGMADSAEYAAWCQIKKRCFNPASNRFNDYGGRGITMAPEWVNDFAAFFAHVGLRPSDKHSIGRIRNEGHYEPGNVQWETDHEQANNKRTVRQIEGIPAHQIAVRHGISKATFHMRLRLGWPVEQAATQPLRGHAAHD